MRRDNQNMDLVEVEVEEEEEEEEEEHLIISRRKDEIVNRS